jgi:cyanophycinase-like exopeptidase
VCYEDPGRGFLGCESLNEYVDKAYVKNGQRYSNRSQSQALVDAHFEFVERLNRLMRDFKLFVAMNIPFRCAGM